MNTKLIITKTKEELDAVALDYSRSDTWKYTSVKNEFTNGHETHRLVTSHQHIRGEGAHQMYDEVIKL